MSALGEMRAWLRSVLLRRRAEREMHEEMSAHIEQAAERYVARGMSEKDALHAARREFGNTASIQEQSRDSRGGRWVEQTLSDVKYALRYFARMPLTTLTIIATLTLGVGANTAAFALYQGMKYRPPPGIPDDPALVIVRGLQRYNGPDAATSVNERQLSLRELREYHAESTFTDVAGWSRYDAIVDFGDAEKGPAGGSVTYVTPNYFRTLGVVLSAGAGFLRKGFHDIDGTELTAVLEHRVAVERFGSAENAIGKQISVNDQRVMVVGVAPPRFSGVPARVGRFGLWVPLSAMRTLRPGTASFVINDSGYFHAAARLRGGVDLASASARVNTIGSRYKAPEAVWEDHTNIGAEAVRARGFIDVSSPRQRAEEMLGSMAIAGLDLIILLVCTTTVSSLLVGAAVARRHEIGVRLALGASRARIVRQLLSESALLAMAGGAGGLLVFATVCRAFAAQVMEIDVNPTWTTAIFTTGFAMLTAILCGLSPALHATRLGLSSTLKESGNTATSRSRLQRTFVVAQIALAQPLLVCLAMFSVFIVNEFGRYRTDGAIEDKIIVARFDGYVSRQAVKGDNSIDEIRQRLEGMSGIVGVTYEGEGRWMAAIELPAGSGSADEIKRAKSVMTESRTVAPNFFDLMDIPIIAGRIPAQEESTAELTHVVVSAEFAQAVFAGANSIGRVFCVGPCGKHQATYRIAAVAKGEGVGARPNRALRVFTPMRTDQYSALMIRTDAPARALAPAIRSLAKVAAPKLPLLSLETVAETNQKSIKEMMQVSGAVAGGGLITLLLGCVGLYAVVSLGVGQRRREIGVRIALGARPRQVVLMFFTNGLRLCLIGLAIGLPLGAAILRVLASQVGFPPTNTVSITTGIAAIVIVVAAFATWLPARRAAGVDPLVALRMQ